jgi:hypothetical protein
MKKKEYRKVIKRLQERIILLEEELQSREDDIRKLHNYARIHGKS